MTENVYQRAWKKICDYAYGNQDLILKEFIDLNDSSGALIQELVDKTVIRAPKGISVTYEGRVGNCPYCGKFIREEQNKHICDCGQRIDWSDFDGD